MADHVAVLDPAVAQLPEPVARGHRVGESAEPAEPAVIVRADSAGCSEGFLAACWDHHVGFYISARSSAHVISAVFDAIAFRDYRTRLAFVFVDRPPPLHPGGPAQSLSLPSITGYWGFYTDQAGDPRTLAVTMRAHAHVEQHICRLKDAGLTRFPFTSFSANATWLLAVALSPDLVRWFQLLCTDGPWREARPKACVRWEMFHAPGRLVHTARRWTVRIVEGWPASDILLGAYRRIALLT